MKRYITVVLAVLWIGAACSSRVATTPAKPAAKAVPATVEQKPPKPARPQKPGVVPAVANPEAPPRQDAGQAPPATESTYVFSPKQAVSALPPASGVPSKPPTATNAPNEGELQLLVVSSAPEIAAGAVAVLDVIATSSAAVVDAPLHLTFDPNVVEFVDGVPGDFLTQGGSSVVFLADGFSRPGDVAIAAGRVDRREGASGSGLLCRIRLRGIRAGTTPVVVGRAKAWGAHGEALNVVGAGTSIVVR